MEARLSAAQWQLFALHETHADPDQRRKYSLALFGLIECRRVLWRVEARVSGTAPLTKLPNLPDSVVG